MGLIAALGFMWLIAFALTSVLRPGEWVERWRLHGAAAAAALTAFLIATTGGFSLLFAHLASPQLRVWARMHVFIAFFALVAIAALLDRALRHPAFARRGRAAAAAFCPPSSCSGCSTRRTSCPPTTRRARSSRATPRSSRRSRNELGPDAAVFQLPYQPFPEWYPSGGTLSFDPFRGYLHSSDLRWSYGAMYGRPEDWQPGVVDETVGQALARISAAGFDGVLVDRPAYPDNARELEAAIAEEAGVEPILSPDGRFSFFDLRPYAEKLPSRRRPTRSRSCARRPSSRSSPSPGPAWSAPDAAARELQPRLRDGGPERPARARQPVGRGPRRATLELAVEPEAPVGGRRRPARPAARRRCDRAGRCASS